MVTANLGKDQLEGFDFEKEAKRIVESAGEKGIILRVLGATAFRIHCPNQLKLHLSMNRNITDLDFVSYSGMKRPVFDLMDKFGYPMDRSSQYVMAVSDRSMS